MNLEKNDVLAPVRQKLLEENQQVLVKLPENLEANSLKLGSRAETTALAGVARAKLRLVASVPAAIAAGIIQYLGGPMG